MNLTHPRGYANVIANATDQNGDAVADGTVVRFYSTGGDLFGPQAVETNGGLAEAQYRNVSDDILVQAYSGNVSSATLSVEVESMSEESARMAAEAAAAAEAEAEAEAERQAEEDAARQAEEDAEAARQAEEDAQAEADAEAEAARQAEIDAAIQRALEAQQQAAEEAAAAAEEAARQAAEEAAAQAAAEAEAAAAAAAAEAARIAATVAPEIQRLTGMSGFVSWLAEGSTNASTLFAALSDAGATAIHLWNGSAWVRYSVVDGSQVPGSVDFEVNRGDVLFISN